MNNKSVLWAAALVAVAMGLASCGGGGGGSADSTAAAPNATALGSAMDTGNASQVSLPAVLAATQGVLAAQASAYGSSKQALFGLNADGTSNAGSVSGIDWDPTHSSVYFSVLDNGRNRVMLPGNWRYADGTAGSGLALAVVGEAPGSLARYAAFGGNPMGARGNAAMDRMLANTIAWLSPRSGAGDFKVVTAHLPSDGTYWFPYEKRVNAWLAAQYPGIAINGATDSSKATQQDRCDGDQLANCLQGADLLILGREQAPNRAYGAADSYPAGYSSDTVMAAVQQAQARGVPVLYLHHNNDSNELAGRMLRYLGLGASTNYWGEEGLKAFNPASLPAMPALSADIAALLQRLDTGSFSTTWSGCVNDLGRIKCEGSGSTPYDTAFTTEFATTAKAIRSMLRSLDASGMALFSQPGYALEKLLVLLGDKYRETVSYPMTKTGSGKDFFRAYFSDMAAYINRPSAAVAKNLGNFSGLLATPVAQSRSVSVAPLVGGAREYMTGLYVMPGRSVTLTRTDDNPAVVRFGLNMLRDTTHVFNTYDRPTMLASPQLALVKDKPVTITSPFGGPLFLFLGASAAAPLVSVQVSGVTTHPVLRDVGDAAQVAAFQAEVASTPTNWVGITTDFLTVHSNLGNFRATMTAYGGNLAQLLSDVWTYMVKDTYELAGFNSATPGTFNLAPTVTAFCSNAGWDCTGVQHRRDLMQHVISDNYAACGDGCSGNPYDEDWPLDPLGWGETHEIGHGIQPDHLRIYGGISGEVSNNIFPTHKLVAYNRATHPVVPKKRGGSGASLAFDILKASFAQANPSDYVKAQIWSDTSYAANNGLRLSFYRQLVEYARYYNSGTLGDGWEIYTLMYLLERNLTASQAGWTTVGAAAPVPATKQVFATYASFPSGMNGNDFMLIASSRIIGRDMRAVFDLWGVGYSAAASAQVVSYAYAAAAPLLFPMADVVAYGAGVGAPISMSGSAVYPAGF